MALTLPHIMIDRVAGISTIRLLMLLAVWGIAVFLWGTFGAWSQQQHLEHEHAIATPYAASLAAWLQQRASVLEPLSTDARLANGLLMPAGVESLPIQRVLYEFAYLNRTPEVYALNLLRGHSNQTAGTTPLPDALLQRLARLPHSDTLMLAALGQNSPQLLFLRHIQAPLPQRLYVGIPQSLASLAGSLPPVPPLREDRTATLVFLHPQGWAQWDMATLRLTFPEALQTAMDDGLSTITHDNRRMLIVPLAHLPGASLVIEGPLTSVTAALLPRLLVFMWAIAMSVMILWHEQALRRVLHTAARPAMPLLNKLAPVGAATKKLGHLSASLKNILPIEVIAKAWRDATNSSPLITGPGDMDTRDFSPPPRRTFLTRPRKPALTMPGLPQSFGTSKDLPKVERRQRGRGSSVSGSPLLPHMGTAKPQWAAPQKPSQTQVNTSPASSETSPAPDEDDMLDVVRDCLRHKRVKLLYQPVFRASDNVPVMHEVYARLLRRNGQEITPGDFLPVATRHRLTLELDLTVLRKVVHEHFKQGGEPLTPLALNISSTSLDGIAYLQEMASQGPRVLRNLGFEVRSQEMIRDPKALKLLKELSKHGGNLAVDYFGGGKAMLDASKAMNFNYVKLDSTRFMENSDGKKELIKLCQHANAIGLPIILEKISHRSHEDFARAAGVQFLQGYALQTPRETLTATPLVLEAAAVAGLAASPPATDSSDPQGG